MRKNSPAGLKMSAEVPGELGAKREFSKAGKIPEPIVARFR
jgi:hypothetical protein